MSSLSEDILKGIKVLEPEAGSLDFLMGETRIIEYPIINESSFKMKDLVFDVETVLKEGKNILKTVNDYAEVIEAPKMMYSGKKAIVKVKVTIPPSYDEYVTKEDGEKVLAPFRIKLRVKGIEFIEEI